MPTLWHGASGPWLAVLPPTSVVLDRWSRAKRSSAGKEERFALADIAGIPSIAAAYRGHGPEAHATLKDILFGGVETMTTVRISLILAVICLAGIAVSRGSGASAPTT